MPDDYMTADRGSRPAAPTSWSTKRRPSRATSRCGADPGPPQRLDVGRRLGLRRQAHRRLSERLSRPGPEPRGSPPGRVPAARPRRALPGQVPEERGKPEPFVPGRPERIEFTMQDVCHTFRPGHRIMVQIQSSWFPLTDRNPQTFLDIPKAVAADFVKADRAHLSRGERKGRVRFQVLDCPARLCPAARSPVWAEKRTLEPGARLAPGGRPSATTLLSTSTAARVGPGAARRWRRAT